MIDFISGVTYALNGFYERVGDKVFLFTPSNIIIADEDEAEPGGKGLYRRSWKIEHLQNNLKVTDSWAAE